MNRYARIISILLVLLIASLLVPLAFSQETTAAINGVVKDQTGAVVANATVEVTSGALLGTKKVTTDSGGAYRVSQLPAGAYTITIMAPGFRQYKQGGIELSAGKEPTIDVSLTIGATGETIEVTGEAPTVDVTQSKVQTNVTHEQLDSMPKGRSFQSLIPLAPGARLEPLQGNVSNRNRGFDGYQMDGASDSENVYMIDGVNVTNVQNGGVGKGFQSEFIQEVQIKSSSYEAEFGGALGGVVNAIPQRGSNNWHGQLVAYYQSSAMSANDPCFYGFTANPGGSTTCGLRLNPGLASANTATSGACVAAGTCRLDGTPEYFVPKKDNRHIIEPGFSIGGPIFTNRLWLFTSYIPTLDTIRRTTTFNKANAGPRSLQRTDNTHNMYSRLDYRLFNSLRLYGSWNYGYERITGALGSPDSAYGQINTGAGVDPNTLRSDAGSVNPNQVFTFGGDWAATSKLVLSARYGYFYSNSETRGTPTGIRYLYDTTVNASSKDLSGAAFPASSFATSGTFNIPSNGATLFNPFRRKSWNGDASYFIGHAWGSHTFKTGYFWAAQSNDTAVVSANPAQVNLDWGLTYTPVTSGTACDQIKQQNVAAGLPGVCQGKYGYFFTGTTTTSNSGKTTQTAQAYYVQDTWTVGRGLTLNLGIRLDQETQPPYDPKRFPTVDFGWGDKIAPRIGGAYDLLHNGKLKVYASYGKFFDIMKMGLARGSFGSDYWHECIYTLDDPDYTKITPTGGTAAPGGCGPSGPAPGVNVGRFIENVDFRATKADPRDPAISPNMKPMAQHEFVTGVDWQISQAWILESRYSRKRLDNTIEDMSITDNLGFYIGNPGDHPFSDVLKRPTSIPCVPGGGFTCTPDAGGNYLNTTPFCAECPNQVKAVRRYDGLEFRLARRGGAKWYGAVSYAYSRLTGNYPGQTDTQVTDGGGGRHSPNNSRLFDLPQMTYLPNGKPLDGVMPTDRPNTAKVYGFYNLKWLGMTSVIGLNQSFFQGSPINSCLPTVGSGSSCQFAEGLGSFARFHRDATGAIINDGVVSNSRTDNMFQTDLSLVHSVRVSKTHENYLLKFELNAFNVLNQRAGMAVQESMLATGVISPNRPKRFANDPGVDWGKMMLGYNYTNALNGTGAFAGTVAGSGTTVQAPLTLASRYGKPIIFQNARQLRLAVRFTF
jgi:hypothetical protein